MAKNETLHTRIEPELKHATENILEKLGLSTADAINIYFRQIVMNGGLPFEVKLPTPNAVTHKAIRDAEKGTDVKSFQDADSMFKELGI